MNILLKRFAERRLTNLLKSNGLQREQIASDGYCFFNAIVCQTGTKITVHELRLKLCSHLKEYETQYIGYMSRANTKDDVEISETYVRKVQN